jgi:hypothetical protein
MLKKSHCEEPFNKFRTGSATRQSRLLSLVGWTLPTKTEVCPELDEGLDYNKEVAVPTLPGLMKRLRRIITSRGIRA